MTATALVQRYSMAEIAELVSLWRNRSRASASVKHIAQRHVEELNARIATLSISRRVSGDKANSSLWMRLYSSRLLASRSCLPNWLRSSIWFK